MRFFMTFDMVGTIGSVTTLITGHPYPQVNPLHVRVQLQLVGCDKGALVTRVCNAAVHIVRVVFNLNKVGMS